MWRPSAATGTDHTGIFRHSAVLKRLTRPCSCVNQYLTRSLFSHRLINSVDNKIPRSNLLLELWPLTLWNGQYRSSEQVRDGADETSKDKKVKRRKSLSAKLESGFKFIKKKAKWILLSQFYSFSLFVSDLDLVYASSLQHLLPADLWTEVRVEYPP